MKIAYVDGFSGVSGDMFLGALVDLGFDFAELARLPAVLGLAGVTVTEERVRRGPFAALKVDVRVDEAGQPHRHLKHVRAILDGAALPEAVRARALGVFERLADAEAAVHGSTREQVHFHEVGAADALVDIVGACLGMERLGIGATYASALALGSGTVTSAHGVLPVPAPATARLLVGVQVDPAPLEGERTTPTGAALVTTFVGAWGPPPPYRLLGQGVGAGGRDPKDRPNVLRILLGETAGAPDTRPLAVLESTLDDATPQLLAHVVARLIAAGARDAFTTPAAMKKGRAGATLTVLCDPERVDALARAMFLETPTIGLRVRYEERRELPREEARVTLPEGQVVLKVVTLPDGTRRARPEYDSLAALAKGSGANLDDLSRRALAAFEARG
jgi:uncharacterized protein (TIGR00299 family) protein